MAVKTLDERVRDLEQEVDDLKVRIGELLRAVPATETIEKKRGNPNWVKKS